MTDDPNLSELLDDDKLPEEYPPDRPLGVEDPDVIPDHLALGDTVAERAAREEPDTLGPPAGDGGHVGHLVEPDQGMGPDVEADAVASLAEEELDGALAEDDIVGGDPTTRDVATERYEDESAEEAAMHLTDPPPMHDSDGYVDDDDAG
jgi:hypothetical protein